MNQELQALQKNNTWELCSLSKGKNVIGSKQVFKVKYRPNGEVERYKAQLVAKGYNQIEGLDFKERLSPIAKIVTVRLFIVLAIIKQWPIFQLDIENLFLHGYLDKEVYMKPPARYSKAMPGQVCLLKDLYMASSKPLANGILSLYQFSSPLVFNEAPMIIVCLLDHWMISFLLFQYMSTISL